MIGYPFVKMYMVQYSDEINTRKGGGGGGGWEEGLPTLNNSVYYSNHANPLLTPKQRDRVNELRVYSAE